MKFTCNLRIAINLESLRLHFCCRFGAMRTDWPPEFLGKRRAEGILELTKALLGAQRLAAPNDVPVSGSSRSARRPGSPDSSHAPEPPQPDALTRRKSHVVWKDNVVADPQADSGGQLPVEIVPDSRDIMKQVMLYKRYSTAGGGSREADVNAEPEGLHPAGSDVKKEWASFRNPSFSFNGHDQDDEL